MALFDIWVKNNKILKAVKVDSAGASHLVGHSLLTTITSSTKKVAEKQSESLLADYIAKENRANSLAREQMLEERKNTQIKLEKEEKKIKKPEVEKKAIYCDFNGVLDDKELEKKCTQHSGSFRLPAITCPHRVMKVAKLALKHNADIIMISLYRLHGFSNYDVIFNRCIRNCGIEEYIQFFKDNEDELDRLIATEPTLDLYNRSNEVRRHIKMNQYSHFVVFEDEHHIDEDLNLIRINWSVGLQDKHIEMADEILSQPF